MDDLIKRLEAATEPSRELDVLCAIATGKYPGVKDEERDRLALEWSAPKVFDDDYTGPFTSTRADQWGIPNYTSSIDAALTLVPDGMQLSIEWPIPHANDDDAEANIYTWDASGTVSEDNWYGRHKLAPIALCIAALKARQ